MTSKPIARIPCTPLRALLTAMVAAALALTGSKRSDGFAYYLLGGAAVAWAGNQSVRYLSPSTFPPNSDPDLQIRSAMGAWNLVPASDFLYSYIRLDQDTVIDHFDGYNDTSAVPAWQLDPGVLGVTYLVNIGPEWFDTDILFSDFPQGVGYNFDLFPTCEVVTQPSPLHGYSFLLIALHELGHGLGLGHNPAGTEAPTTPWSVATMNPRYPSGGTLGQENIIEPHTDDRNGVRFLYPHSGPSAPPYRDLANSGYTNGTSVGKAVPVFFDPPSARPGEVVRLRSGIQNFGTTNEFSVSQGFYISTDSVIDVSDEFLGGLLWDIAFQDAFRFDVDVPIPEDWPAGTFYLGSILDDLDEVPEVYEDNNAVSYCEPLLIERMPPVIGSLGQRRTACGLPFTGPTPSVSHPLNMSPVTWTLDNPERGMSIHPETGVVSWPRPVASPFLYTLYLRATNSAGSDTEILYLGVDLASPRINPIPDAATPCHTPYVSARPQLTAPECMNPILIWSLNAAPQGMTIHPATGVITWPDPLPSTTSYRIEVRAANVAGDGTKTFYLNVKSGDLTGDGHTDRYDASRFTTCLSGPGFQSDAGCNCADADIDTDVDLGDIAAFQRAFGN